jgi:threonine dehydratase
MFELGRQLVDGSLVSRLDDVEGALRLIVTRNHVVPEGAGSVDVAAALGGESGEGCVTCVVSDGNIDVGLLARLLEADVS